MSWVGWRPHSEKTAGGPDLSTTKPGGSGLAFETWVRRILGRPDRERERSGKGLLSEAARNYCNCVRENHENFADLNSNSCSKAIYSTKVTPLYLSHLFTRLYL